MKRTITIALAVIVGVAIAGTATVALAGRNSSGTYTVGASGTYPFVSGTSISSATMNSIFGDLAQEMTDSLSRSGKGGMLVPMRVPDGSSVFPAFAFTNETSAGWYRAGTGDLRLVIGGTDRCKVTSSGLNVTGAVAATGNVSAGGTLTSTGSATVGGTLGVTGAITGASLAVSDDAGVKRGNGTLNLGTTGNYVVNVVTNGVTALSVDGSQNVDLKNHTVYGLAAPVAADYAANKAYVDSKIPLYGTIKSDGTIIARSDTGITAARTAEGAFSITHSSLSATSVLVVTNTSPSDYGAGYSIQTGYNGGSTHTWSVQCWENGVGAASDCSFSFIAYP